MVAIAAELGRGSEAFRRSASPRAVGLESAPVASAERSVPGGDIFVAEGIGETIKGKAAHVLRSVLRKPASTTVARPTEEINQKPYTYERAAEKQTTQIADWLTGHTDSLPFGTRNGDPRKTHQGHGAINVVKNFTSEGAVDLNADESALEKKASK